MLVHLAFDLRHGSQTPLWLRCSLFALTVELTSPVARTVRHVVRCLAGDPHTSHSVSQSPWLMYPLSMTHGPPLCCPWAMKPTATLLAECSLTLLWGPAAAAYSSSVAQLLVADTGSVVVERVCVERLWVCFGGSCRQPIQACFSRFSL